MKKVFSMVLVLVMVLSLAACGTNEGEATVSDTEDMPATTTVNESAVERPNYVKGVDEVTGTITVYTTMEETQQVSLKEIFDALNPPGISRQFKLGSVLEILNETPTSKLLSICTLNPLPHELSARHIII